MILKTIQREILKRKPRVHSITNTITINDCANIILAAGASAVMAADAAEAAEMTGHTDALVLNLGAVSSLDAMLLAGKEANIRKHPIVFDPVAAGATKLRREASLKLMEQLTLTAIRGNAAEIHTLAVLSRSLEKRRSNTANSSIYKQPDSHNPDSIVSLVDVDIEHSMQKTNLESCLSDAGELSTNTGAIVAVSGKEDLIVSQGKHQMLTGGSVLSSYITGSGCMLTELIAVCLTVIGEGPDIVPWDAVCSAVQWMNLAAEEAERRTRESQGGTMSYRMHLIDAISKPLLQAK